MPDQTFAERLRRRDRLAGYWTMSGSPAVVRRVASVGYDFVVIDAQHGFGGYSEMLSGIMATAGTSMNATIVRVGENSGFHIGRALDAGADGVIVPMIRGVEEVLRAVEACRYPPRGVRSFGPVMAVSSSPRHTSIRDHGTLCIAMIETMEALGSVEEICAVEGLDGIYVGSADLSIAMGGAQPFDPTLRDELSAAFAHIARVAERWGVAAGMHCSTGDEARAFLKSGYSFAAVAYDLNHLEQAARQHLVAAQG